MPSFGVRAQVQPSARLSRGVQRGRHGVRSQANLVFSERPGRGRASAIAEIQARQPLLSREACDRSKQRKGARQPV